MSSTMSETADGTAPEPGTGSVPTEKDVIDGTVVPPTRAFVMLGQPTLHVVVGLVGSLASADDLGFCVVSDLARAFMASLPAIPEAGPRVTSGESISIRMALELVEAFLALQAASIAVGAESAQDFAMLVLSRAWVDSGDTVAPVSWGVAVLGVSSIAPTLNRLGSSSLRELPSPGHPWELHGSHAHPEITAAQPSQPADPREPTSRKNRLLPWNLLAQREFRLYFLGSLATNFGTWLQSTAQVLLAYRLTHSFFAVGLISSAQFAGMIVVSPWAAVLVTRFSSRAVLIGTQCVSATVAIMMACCYANGDLSVQLLALGALILGFSYSLALPIQTALVPTLVDEEDIANAVRMNSVSYNAGRALAPALSVVVIASLGPGPTFILNAISFVIFALFLRRLSHIAQDTPLHRTLARACRTKRLAGSPPPAARTADPGNPDRDVLPVVLPAATGSRSGQQSRVRVTDGLMVALRNRRILLLLAIVAAVTLADDPVMVLSPALAHAKLHISNEWSGYFIAALGWGSVLGSVIPASTKDQGAQRASRYAALSLLALGGSVFAFTQGFSPWASLIAAIAAGVAGLFAGTAAQSALLRHQKDRGASPTTVASVAALWAIAWAGTKPFASLLDGLLASHIGVISTSVWLAAPAVTIALCELLLPRKLKQSINSGAEFVTTKVIPRFISAARTLLRAKSPWWRQFELFPVRSAFPERRRPVSAGPGRLALVAGTCQDMKGRTRTRRAIVQGGASEVQEAPGIRSQTAVLQPTW
jgi:MFS family permease